MTILALDIGKKRTGAAFTTTELAVPLALDTITHVSLDDLVEAVRRIVEEKGVEKLIVGLPLLLSGAEGEQSQYVRIAGEKLATIGLDIVFLDERYTTPKTPEIDPDAASACQILATYLDKESV